MKVEEMMNKSIESVPAETSVNEVMKLMTKKMIRSVLVRPKDDSDGFGIVAVRDIFNKVLAKNIDPAKVSATDVATKPNDMCENRYGCHSSHEHDAKLQHCEGIRNRWNYNCGSRGVNGLYESRS